MIYELTGHDRVKIIPLIKNSQHELTIESVIYGNSPGNIYIDNTITPKSGYIETPECNVIFGISNNSEFNSEIKEKIGKFDQVTCDEPSWNDFIENHHCNRAIKKYSRCYYKLDKSSFIGLNNKREKTNIDLLYAHSLKDLNYANSKIVSDWINIVNVERFEKICLAAIVNIDNTIASCSAIDCIVDDKIEIGIQTARNHRKKGYGISAVESLIQASFLNGIKEIGWHCVSTNTGSRKIAEKLGFRLIKTYEAYTPYPPIENISDLTGDEWNDYANFYMEKATNDPEIYWFAMKCWANIGDLNQVNTCIQNMLDNKLYWFISKIDESEEFYKFKDDISWIKIKDKLQLISK